jgi:putative acetyltransferase
LNSIKRQNLTGKKRNKNMFKIIRTNSENHDFIELVKLLDADLVNRDGMDQGFYAQFNKIDKIRYVVLAYLKEKPLGCGAMKEIDPGKMEIKRMYVTPESRNKGIATMILAELEKWAIELSSITCMLETGKRQPEAIELYKKCGYSLIPNYGQYTGVENSVCFEKIL